jgi:hypothetical protein
MTEISNFKTVLQPGMIIKNYKKLCELLSEKEVEGDSKQAQIKEWQRCFNFEKEGQKYIVIKIYDEILPKDDKRVIGNNSEYISYIQLLLLNYLSKQEGYTATLSTKQIMLILGMINQNYIDENYNDIVKGDITIYHVNHFYQRSYKKLCDVLYSALNNLQNRRLVTYFKKVMINESIESGQTIIREATDVEIKTIQAVEREVLKNMGLESIIQIHLKFQQKRFYKMVNNILTERYGINYSYTLVKLIFHHEHIVEALEQAQIEMNKKMLNSKLIDSVNEQAKRNFEKNRQEFEQYVDKVSNCLWDETNFSEFKKPFKLDDIYLYVQKELAEYLMRY